METPLRVLLVEDSESDAALIIRQLKKAGYAVTAERVEAAEPLIAALKNQTWDCVITDYKLPQFDAPAALAVVQATGLDLPIIVVSGTIGEETAVALMKAGAHDYLMKDNLARLAPAVQRELAEKRLRDEKRQAEQALIESMTQYRLLADNISDVIWILDLQTARFTYVSPSAEQLYGYTVAEVLAQDMSSIFTPDSLVLFQKNTPGRLASAQQGQCGPYLDEVEQPRKDGTAIWTETTTHYHFNADSSHWEAYGVSRDITARKRAEDALRESEERYHLLFENAPVGILSASAQGQIVELNLATLEILGSPSAEATRAINVLTFPPLIQAGFSPDFLKCVELGQPVWGACPYVSTWGKSIYFHYRLTPISAANGQTVQVQILLEDITERQRAEDALRESEARFRWLFTTSPDAIVLIDPHAATATWPIVDCNEVACQMNGYTREELIGQSIDLLNTAPGTHEERLAYLDRLRREGVLHVEAFHRHQDGHVFPIEVSTSLFTFEGRELVLGIDRDITERKRAEEALRDSETHYRALVESLPGVVYSFSTKRGGLYYSSHVTKLLGYSPDQLYAQPQLWHDSIHPDALPRIEQAIRDAAAGKPFRVEYRIRDAHGNWHWFDDSSFGYRMDGSEVIIEGLALDITERKQAEETLRESERRERERVDELQTIMDTVPTMIWIAHDQMSQIVTGNRAAYELLRMPPQSNASLTAPEGQRPTHVRICQNGVELSLNELPLQVSAATGVEIRDFEEEIVFDDGTIMYTLGNVMPLFGEDGRPRGAVGAFIDITERKQAEKALRNSEERFRRYFELGLIGMAITLPTKGIVEVNDQLCAILGYERGELLHMTWEEMSHPDDRAADVANFSRVLAGEIDGYSMDKRWIRKDGQIIDSTISVKCLRRTDGSVDYFVSLVQDITERKRMEVQLREQVATLHALAEIDREITAAPEAASVLDLVCRRAAELVHAPKSALITRMATAEMDLTASYGLRDAARVGAEFTRTRQAGLMNLSVLKTHEVLALNEITADTPFMPETFSREGVQAIAIVPLVSGEEPSGALIVLDTTARQWQAADLQVLSMLAGLAALTLEKLRLLETARSRALHLATLNEIGQAITSSLDLDLVLTTLLEKVRQATGAEACSVALIEQESGDLVFRQAVGGVAYEVIGLRLPPGQGLAGWVAQHRQSVLVPDAAVDARSHPLPNQGNFVTRDLIAVPLIARDVVTGVIELVNKRSGRFGEDDRRLLESVAAQAAIAIENARLFETEQVGRTALETLYRIGQAVNSTLDADTILDQLTDEAMRATHATHGSALVARPDQGRFERRSLRGYSPEQAARARTDRLPLDRGVNGRAYRSRRVVYVEDVQLDPDYHPLIAETHSELAVPIVRGGQVIGNLDLQSPTVDAFHDVRLDFLQALTDQVAIALENARLFDETRRRMDEMSIVSQVALVGAAGRPFDETVARATDALSQLWPTAALGFLLVDETGQALRMHSSYFNPLPDLDPMVSIALEKGLTGWAARQQQPIRVGDVTTDPRYVAKAALVRSEMVAPLVVGSQVIGVVNVEAPWPDAFSGDDLRLLTTLAGQLAVIFEKARLDAELAGHAAQLEQRVHDRTAEIRREQARTQAILDALGEGVVVTDPQGAIQYMNRAMEQTTGFGTQEVIGQEGRLWRSGQTPEEVYQAMWTTVLAGQTWYGEVVNRRKDGELYFASLTTAPILTTDGGTEELAGVVSIQRDITERKRAEEEMRRALRKEQELNNLKSNFVSLTSHEFRTPLTTILSSAEMLEHYGERWTPEKKLEHLRRIQTAVKYMTTLLNDILIIGKAEAGKLEFMPAPLDLVKFCRDLVEELQLTDKTKHLLIFDSEGDCAQASMDEQLLRHIVSNLLSNALKYSPQGGIVQFDLACQTGQAVFRIQDHGLGIPPEDQARLFETFHRASNVRNIAGTGLGLAIVKRSVELHGGAIDVASQVGVGTTVTVTLPLGALNDA